MVDIFKILRGNDENEEPVQENVDNTDNNNEAENKEFVYESPTVKEGKVRIHSTSVTPIGNDLMVGFFVSNGLKNKIRFESVPLVLIDSKEQILAHQTFDGEVIGEVAPGTEKACVVRFLSKNIQVMDIPEDCEVRFVMPKAENNKMEFQDLPKDIPDSQREALEGILAGLPPLKPGEVNFSPLQAHINEEKNLLAAVVIRNGSNKTINIEELPLAFFDANKEEVIRGQFSIENLSVQPHKAVIWTFNFGPLPEDKEEVDLSKWSINIVK